MLDFFGADLVVPLVTGERVRYVNLDCAASPPCLKAAHDAVLRALPAYASVHRGAGYASVLSTRLFEQSREEIGAFVGARRGDQVILTRNTTEALNLLAAALPSQVTVVTFASEHHANLLPWRGRSIELPAPRSEDEAVAAVDRALPRGGLLAVTGASNVTGELWPIARLCSIAKARGARVVVDAAQLAPHRRIRLDELGADWVAFSAHKLYAPFGAGALVGRADWLDEAEPWLAGGGAVRRVFAGSTELASGPARHEAGTPNLPGAVAFAAACGELSSQWAAIEAHESALLARLLRGVRALPGVRVLDLLGAPRIGVVSMTVEGWEPSQLSAALSDENGIGVRDGAFCAHQLVATLAGGPALRASLGASSRADDVDRFVTALGSILERGVRSVRARDAVRPCAATG
jgi:selenocysteine lyase/cysteine desulfurase